MKRRLDELLVVRELAPSLELARSFVMAGRVYRGEQRLEKPGLMLAEEELISLRSDRRFVSRGGDKLEGALRAFGAHFSELQGRVGVDVGAATGGFTDCLLQRGIDKMYTVDVSVGQLALSLRQNERVVVRERTNAKTLTSADFAEPVDLVVVDASFVGIGALLPAIARVLRPGGDLVALVKPQFEASKAVASRGRGVVRGDERQAAIELALSTFRGSPLVVKQGVDSEVAGPKGNVEHFAWAVRSAKEADGQGQG